MTTHRDFKKIVRARMSKTGESYTAARSQLQKTRAPRPTSHAPEYAKLAGMSDAKVSAATGHTWAEWTALLDDAGAQTWPHGKLALHVHETHGVREWWTQTVAVGYERIKGRRAIGQRMDGSYEATRSRTLPVTLTKMFAAWHSPRARKAWLGDVKLTVRSTVKNKSLRITWDDGRPVEVYLQSPARGKAQVAVAHRKLASKADADRARRYWAEKLDALEEYLTA
jgi:hypothetical protein